MELKIELEQETDGRWIAEVLDLPGVMVYGDTPAEALVRVKALALHVIADRLAANEIALDDAISFTQIAA
jgi:predicted RNase H-like HicB family nuclease